MTTAKPLLVLLDDLRVDAEERLAFNSDPEGYLASHGWVDLDPGELREALDFAKESMPLDVAVTIPDVADLTDYVAAIEPQPIDDVDSTFDVEDFGADALPAELDDDLLVEHDDDAPVEPDFEDEPLTVDLGPDDDLVADDDDDDDDDDPFDV